MVVLDVCGRVLRPAGVRVGQFSRRAYDAAGKRSPSRVGGRPTEACRKHPPGQIGGRPTEASRKHLPASTVRWLTLPGGPGLLGWWDRASGPRVLVGLGQAL